MLERFAIAFASDPTHDNIKTALRLVAIKHPDLDKAAKTAAISKSPQKIERAFETAVGILRERLPDCDVVPLGATDLARRGGVFNCVVATYRTGSLASAG